MKSSSPLEGSVRLMPDEGCNRTMIIILERRSESHPPSLHDTSLKGGGSNTLEISEAALPLSHHP
ncbi:MAG: hypothetical protein IIB40_11735 [Candidatus Marinimicrobia bacterium]|nr:hypothetical protein [Candidatus Neomarinimicrobiota bacterium]